MRSSIYYILAIAAIVAFFSTSAEAQRRDYLTDEEIEIVRDAQEIDTRIAVLVHAIDRRLAVLKINVGNTEKELKEKEVWGALPTGSKIELLSDVKRILQKAIDDIDNLAARPDSAVIYDTDGKKPKTPKDLFNKAVRTLAAAAARYRPVFEKELSTTEVKTEKGVYLDLIENCSQVIEAVTKLPAEVKKTKN
jgi:uncharacterized protein YydD (DUF2326 family)